MIIRSMIRQMQIAGLGLSLLLGANPAPARQSAGKPGVQQKVDTSPCNSITDPSAFEWCYWGLLYSAQASSQPPSSATCKSECAAFCRFCPHSKCASACSITVCYDNRMWGTCWFTDGCRVETNP